MRTLEIKKAKLIWAGNYFISIGTYEITDVAIISKSTGEFAKIENAGIKLGRIKRKFKSYLNSADTFTFSFMQPETTIELIKALR